MGESVRRGEIIAATHCCVCNRVVGVVKHGNGFRVESHPAADPGGAPCCGSGAKAKEVHRPPHPSRVDHTLSNHKESMMDPHRRFVVPPGEPGDLVGVAVCRACWADVDVELAAGKPVLVPHELNGWCVCDGSLDVTKEALLAYQHRVLSHARRVSQSERHVRSVVAEFRGKLRQTVAEKEAAKAYLGTTRATVSYLLKRLSDG